MIVVFFVVIFSGSVALVLWAGREPLSKKAVGARLAMIGTSARGESGKRIELAGKSRPRWSDRVGERVKSCRLGESLERLLVQSGSGFSIGKVLMVSAGLGCGAGAATQWWLGFGMLSLMAAALSGVGPCGYLLVQRSRRVARFNAGLADAIDLMARALRAGHSMASTIEVIAQQSPEPLAGEFARCFQQQKFGIPFRDALLAMGERVPSDDLQFLITAVLVQKETGGDLTDILDRTTAVIRDRVRIQGEVSTKTAQGRLTGWILSGLPIVLLILINIITPGYSHVLFCDPVGQKLLMAGGGLILLGGFIIGKIVDIRV